MSKFDLRKYIPLLGAMGYLDEPPKNKKIEPLKQLEALSDAIRA